MPSVFIDAAAMALDGKVVANVPSKTSSESTRKKEDLFSAR
jgi:hypothetical protein